MHDRIPLLYLMQEAADFPRVAVRPSDRIIANTERPSALCESGFAPRCCIPRAQVDESAFPPVERSEHPTWCPYKGLCSYYDIGDAHLAVWSCRQAIPRLNKSLTLFEPDSVSVQLDGK
jgi:uncharacterized protein (DUF427 family)